MAWGVPKIGAVAEANGGNLTLAEPAGIAQGDLMVACFAIRSTVGFTNSDWVKVESKLTGDTVSTGAGIASSELWICVRGSSAPTLLFSRTGGDVARGLIIAYAGGKKNVTAVLSVHSSNTLASASVTATTTTLTTVEANELIVAMCAAGDNYTASAFKAATDPATQSGATDTTSAPTAGTWFERSDSGTNTGADTGIAVADAVRSAAGATGTIQTTSSGSARHSMIAAAFRLLVDTAVAVGLGAVTIAGFAPTVTATSNVSVATGLGAVTIAGFSPTVTVSVQNTNVATGLGAVTIAGFAPTVAVAPALNYAIDFAVGAYSRLGDEGSPITDLKNATALGMTLRVRGDRLKNTTTNGDPFAQLNAGYLYLFTDQPTAGNISVGVGGAGLTQGTTDPPTAQSGLDATGYYTIRAWRDASATHDLGVEIFKPDGTLLTSVTSDQDGTFTNGVYGDFSLNFLGGTGAGSTEYVCDWAACWDRIPPGVGSAPTEPTGSPTGLLHFHRWNENGGTIGDDQQSATNAVLTGTYTWILISTGTTATPAVGAVTVAGLAPQVNLGIVPAVGAVTIAGFAPSAIADTKITTGLGAVTIAGFAPSAIADTKITTGLGAVTVAGFAPTVQTPVVVTPATGTVTVAGFATTLGLTIYGETGSVTLAGFSPTVVTPNTVTTDVGAVTVAGFAPAVQLPVLVTADTGTVTTTGFAPSIIVGFNVFPDVGSVTLAGFSPTVTASDHQTVSTQLGDVTIAGFTPSLDLAVTPGTGQVTVTGFAPSILVSDNQTAATQTGTVAIDGFAPTPVLPVTVTTDLGAVVIAGFTPTISVTAGTILTDLGLVTVSGFAPIVTATAHQTVTTGLGIVTIAGFAPQVNVTATPGTGLVSVTGFAPSIATTNNQAVTPGLGTVDVTGLAPTLTVAIRTGLGAVTVTGFAPTAVTPVTVATGLGSVIEVGYRPTVTASNHQTVTTGLGAITITGFAPSAAVDFSAQTQTGTVAIAGFAPTLINPAGAFPGVGLVTVTGFAPTVAIPVVLIPVIAGPLYPLTPGLIFRDLTPGLLFRQVQPALTMQAVAGDFQTIEVALPEPPDPSSVTPGVGVVTVAGFAPAVVVSNGMAVTTDVGVVTLIGFAPAIGTSGSATPNVGVIGVVGLSPIVDVAAADAIHTDIGAVTLAGLAPTVTASDHRTVTPGVGIVTVTGRAPSVGGQDPITVTPGVGVVTLAGFAPSIGELAHPNEPANMTVLWTHDGTAVAPPGWFNNTGQISIETDPEKGSVLQLSMSPMTAPGSGTARIDTGTPETATFGPTKLYIAFWEKLSPNFKGNNGAGGLKNVIVKSAGQYFDAFVSGYTHMPGFRSDPGDVDSTITLSLETFTIAEYEGETSDPPDIIVWYAPFAADVFTRDEWHFVEVLISVNTPGNADGHFQGWIDGVSFPVTVVGSQFVEGTIGSGIRSAYDGMGRFTGVEITNVWGGGGTSIAADNWNRFKDIYISGGFARAGERPDHWVVTSLDGTTVSGGSDVRLTVQLTDENDDAVDIFNPNPETVVVTRNGVTQGGQGVSWDYRAGTPPDYVEGEHGCQLYTLHTTAGAATWVFTVTDHSYSNNFQTQGAARTGSITITTT